MNHSWDEQPHRNPREIVTFDAANPETLHQALSHQTLLTGGANRWQGLHFHHLNAPEGEVFEAFSLQHLLVIHLDSLTEDRWLDGQFKQESYAYGDSLIVPAMATHRSYQFSDTNEMMMVGIETDFLDRVALDTFDRNRVELIPHFSHSNPLILQLALELKNDLAAGSPAGLLYGESIAHTLAAHLVKQYTVDAPKVKSLAGKLSDLQVRQAIDYIQAHLDLPLSLAELAAIAQLSPYHFTRLFKQTTGLAPHQYVIYHRIDRSKQLLKQRQISIAQVALEVGFSNQGHFTKCFSKHTGSSPKSYRDAQ
jgi:AraC family transcriptional regulator